MVVNVSNALSFLFFNVKFFAGKLVNLLVWVYGVQLFILFVLGGGELSENLFKPAMRFSALLLVCILFNTVTARKNIKKNNAA